MRRSDGGNRAWYLQHERLGVVVFMMRDNLRRADCSALTYVSALQYAM